MVEYTLASGKKVTVRDGKARDLVKAQMIASRPEEIPLALVSLLAEFDGAQITMEDVAELPLQDFIEILPFLGLSPQTLQRSLSVSAGKPGSDTTQ